MSTAITTSLLHSDAKAAFIRDGFLIRRGLLSTDLVDSTRREILAAPCWPGQEEGEQKSGISVPLWGASLPTVPCRTGEIEQIAEELVGPHFLRGHCFHFGKELAGLPAREEGFVPVVTFPTAGPQRFQPPSGYHLDGYPDPPTLWPGLLLLIVFAYLTDTTDYGGATVVLPGSHRQVFDYWHREGVTASHQLPPLEFAAPLPIAGQAGDVIFMHYLLVHSGSSNFAGAPRIGMNTAIAPDPQQPYQQRFGSPNASWTPLDYTLRTDTASALTFCAPLAAAV